MPKELATTSGDPSAAGAPIPSVRGGKHLKDLPMGQPDYGFERPSNRGEPDVRRHDEMMDVLKEIRDILKGGNTHPVGNDKYKVQ